MTALEPARRDPAPVAWERLSPRARAYAEASIPHNTRRAYRADWNDWTAWCEANTRQPLPADPGDVADYISDLADLGRAPATIQRRLACLATLHKMEGHPAPADDERVRKVWRGIARTRSGPQQHAAPLNVPILRTVVQSIPGDLPGLRDRAIFLMGVSGAYRRSELAALLAEDISVDDGNLRVLLRASKTDQEGAGKVKGLMRGSNPATDPVRAWLAWQQASVITTGPAFRGIRHGKLLTGPMHPDTVGKMVKRRILASGVGADGFSGHSLRSGFATWAAKMGVPMWKIADQTGHKSLDTLKRYITEGELFTDNPSGQIGL